ncbi:TPA: HNH endonuclease [Proteus mirabilis]|nr:HNH endonuclease [Proteus mirabilis]HEK0647734.1 HNH endonuclease [Proteus mirabilis]
MASLKPVARIALNKKEFRNVISSYLAGDIEWSDASLKPLKDLMRILLRREQKGICPYCQRRIIPERRNLGEHIEHFLDKSKDKYKKFALTASNLVLACQGCNVEKGTKDLNKGRITPLYLNSAAGPFLWPHPYFDDMSACIRKLPGPVYSVINGSGRENQASKLITDLKLNEIRSLEIRYSRLSSRRDRLINILARLAAKGNTKRMIPISCELKKVNDELNNP